MTDQPQTLRELARNAVTVAEAEHARYIADQQEARRLSRLENLRREINKSPHLADAIIDETNATATIDGLTFTSQPRRGLFLLAHCSICGQLMSADIQSLLDLGEALPHLSAPEMPPSPFDGWTDEPHHHPEPMESPAEPPGLTLTPAERAFVAALRDLLAEADAEAD